MKPLLMIVGPTGAGKSEFALRLAEAAQGELVNFDSLQVYKKLDIGTAKPSAAERKRLPHHLFDLVSPPAVWNVKDFVRASRPLINERINEAPLVGVGGSGFYIQGFQQGLLSAPASDPEIAKALEDELQQKGLKTLYQVLQQADPSYAAKIHPNDAYRTLRGLNILRSSGRAPSESLTPHPEFGPYDKKICKIGIDPDRNELKERLSIRIKTMMKLGFVEEVESLIEQGLMDWAPMRSVGYKEVGDYLKGQMNQDELFGAILKSTLSLAKRQRTWFHRDPQTLWIEGIPSDLSELFKFWEK